MKQKKIIINKTKFNIIVERLSHQIIENHADFQDSVLIGIQPRGTHLCKRIHNKLTSIISNSNIKVGNLDITFYRDDFRRREEPLEPQTPPRDGLPGPPSPWSASAPRPGCGSVAQRCQRGARGVLGCPASKGGCHLPSAGRLRGTHAPTSRVAQRGFSAKR